MDKELIRKYGNLNIEELLTELERLTDLCSHAGLLESQKLFNKQVEQIQIMRDALRQIEDIQWGYDGDCGAQQIIDKALRDAGLYND